MFRPLLVLAAALLLSGCGEQGNSTQHDWPEPTPAIWQVTSPTGEYGWLFGTVHALPDGVEWQSDAVQTAFAEADLLVVEIVNLGDTASSFEQFQQRAYSQGLPELAQRVEASERPALAALMERASADADDFADMESWAAALVLSGGIRTGDPQNGVDRALLASGKPTQGLESFALQYDLFDRLAPEDQVDLLVAIADEASEPSPNAAIDAWLTGDLAQLDELTRSSMLAFPVLREALLDGRNRNWAEHVIPLIETGREPFVAVGAAHMLGDTGLPALLTAHGFVVERVQ